jgi:3-hydroxybutyryl-CoA dehydrogenase
VAWPGTGGDAGAALDAAAIVERILLPIVDEAARAAAEGVATRSDIDVALRLGAAHPVGPFERLAEAGGPAVVARRLRELARDDPSFAPSAALAGA